MPDKGRSRILGKEGCSSGYHEVKLGATRSWDYSPLVIFYQHFHAGELDGYKQVAGTGLDRVNVTYQERC